MTATVAPWLARPLAEFVRQSRVHLAVVLEPSGRVLAQHGFTRSVDVMAACSLVAAIHASATELGRQLSGAPFGPLHHGGAARQVYLAPSATGAGTVLLLAVFDEATSLGLVRHYHAAFARSVEAATAQDLGAPGHSGDLERDLGRNLAVLFGRA